MPVFATSTGNVTVNNWGYQLHAPNGLNATALANETHDLIVMDFSSDGTGANSFSSAQISAIKDGPGGRTVAVAYISIGEATEFRDLWDASWTSNGLASGTLTASAPSWLGPTNPEWPEGRKVRYWDSDWQDKIFNDAGTGWLDKIVAQGFDAAYLDIVGAYYYWAVDVPASERQTGDPAAGDEKDAAQRMIDFIVDLTAHARQTNPYFFVIPQNGEFILDALEGTDPVRKAAYLDAVGAIGVEDIYNPGNLDENNPFSPDAERISVLQNDFLGNGIPVFSVDYVNTSSLVTSFENQAAADGFIAYAAPDRDLNVMGPEIGAGPGAATSGDDNLTGTTGADSINGLAGNDIIEGLAGADFLDGGPDTDTLSYQNSGAAVTVNLQLDTASGGDAAGDIISNFENVEGSAFDDDIRGTTGVNTLNGNDGADTIRGDSGDDTINGGAGNDQLYGERDNDTINGGAGNDRIHGGNLDDTINGDAGADTLIGDAGSDTIHGG
ncbi:MAG TPA: hypothetical protein ENJ55_04990, partial [Rhizobiales bacterium]|nr:hypothetical protein [Hyphomicrobiales bacterium]